MRTIIVFFDSLNKRFLPCFNEHCDIDTPNFDRLSKHTVRFSNSFVGSMPCIPARRELHTGRYNFLHREWGPLEPYDDSMIEILKQHGIYTHLISDHLHYWEDGGCNYHTRYNSWEIVRGQEGDKWKGQVKDPYIPDVERVPCAHSGAKVTSNWRNEWVNRQYIHNLEDFPQSKVFQLGEEFIQNNNGDDNWLLHIETFDPHEPFFASKEFRDKYPEQYNGKFYDWPRGPLIESDEVRQHVVKEYKSLMSMCDYHLGKVLDLMDQYQMWEDTMLIVGTDHGILLGEHDWWSKNLMPYYDEIANTPLFIWDPRSKECDVERSTLVQLIDWAPTILNFYGIQPPKDMQGVDVASSIANDSVKLHEDGVLYGAFSAHVNFTDGKYTLMKAPKMELKDEVYNYTLMPQHMTSRFSTKELENMELVDPFKFTKNCKVLKIKSKDKYDVAKFGDLMFNRQDDPYQNHNIKDMKLKNDLSKKMIKLMEENDAPKELYIRLGLEKDKNEE